MLKIGIKLWSMNIEVLSQVSDMHSRDFFDYIELYFVPGTLQEVENRWDGLKIPFVIHAPHFGHGFNLADENLRDSNFKIFKDVLRCADILRADMIIAHGGNGGTKSEAIRQLKILKDSRVIIENKPRLGLNGKECIGCTPEDIVEIVNECGLKGFVLDFNHAVCAARSVSYEPLEYIRRFLSINPKMFHLGDGDYYSLVDTHMNLGHGTMPLTEFIAFLFQEASVTLETPNDFSKGFRDFEENRVFFNLLLDSSLRKTN
ncbi:MAG: TIM barrel protein [Candidatus Omnitrophota bacterium]|nr:TIM barrel protein [Candidatus Omnitrophota bacterium]